MPISLWGDEPVASRRDIMRTQCALFFLLGALTTGFGDERKSADKLARELAKQEAGPAIAEPLVSDRPGYSDGVTILGRGILQLETGINLTSLSEESFTEHNFTGGSPTLRLGVGRGVELRFGGDGFRTYSRHGAGTDPVEQSIGASDFSAGAKMRLTRERGVVPELTFIPLVSLPVGHQSFTSSGLDPTLKLAWSKSLREGLSASGNVNVSSLSEDGDRYLQQAFSFQVGRGFGRRWAGFGEIYTVSPVATGGSSGWTFDGGVSYSITRDSQFDVSVGQQVIPMARCWFIAAGYVVRRAVWLPRR
ncbi:MAG: transporter [Bryobacterales bacterium]|nr:transporter [Bryobacterales bacterium]